jgi:ABC-type Fe2+-enterobactin transport system substrate-binding protein
MCKLLARGALVALLLAPVIASSATAPTMEYANDRLTVHAARRRRSL